jgi:hypothetical protein
MPVRRHLRSSVMRRLGMTRNTRRFIFAVACWRGFAGLVAAKRQWKTASTRPKLRRRHPLVSEQGDGSAPIQMEAEFDLYHAGPKIRAACARMRQFPMPSIRSPNLSVAFTKEESAETASETLLPDRPISPHPNLVTEQGLKALEFQLQRAREAYEAVQRIEDVNERRREAAIPVRDIRYFSERMRTAQVVADPHPVTWLLLAAP